MPGLVIQIVTQDHRINPWYESPEVLKLCSVEKPHHGDVSKL